MERKFCLVVVVTCLFLVPISPSLLTSNSLQDAAEIKRTEDQNNNSSTSIILIEIGPFKSSIETFVSPINGTEFPVLYLKESFHIDAALTQPNGQPIGSKCLNIYMNPEEIAYPLSSIVTNESDGTIQWFSGDPTQNPSLRGVEVSSAKKEGFRTLRIAYEPDKDVNHGCDRDTSDEFNGSFMDVVVLVKSRVDIQVGTSWYHGGEFGLTEGELVVGEVSLVRDRLDLAIEGEEISFRLQYLSTDQYWVTNSVINSVTNEQGVAYFEWEYEGKTCDGNPCSGTWRIISHFSGSMYFSPSQDNISFVIDYKESESTNDNPDEEISENNDDDQTSNDDQDGESLVNNVDNETPGNTVIQEGTTNSLSGESEQDVWSKVMDIVEISALVVSVISLLLYLARRNRQKEADLEMLAEKIVNKQNSVESNHNFDKKM